MTWLSTSFPKYILIIYWQTAVLLILISSSADKKILNSKLHNSFLLISILTLQCMTSERSQFFEINIKNELIRLYQYKDGQTIPFKTLFAKKELNFSTFWHHNGRTGFPGIQTIFWYRNPGIKIVRAAGFRY
jgi:hypothetical protein